MCVQHALIKEKGHDDFAGMDPGDRAGGGSIQRCPLFRRVRVAKFTPAEATAIYPLLLHSPFLFWLPRLVDQQLSSDVIGVVEIALALMMASRPVAPWVSAIGSCRVSASLVVTLSFLITTPRLDPALGAFIVKDLTLLGVALWSGGEALAAIKPRVTSL